jgi:MFS family permease
LIINAATVVLLQVPLDLLVQRYQVRRVIYVAVAFYATAFIVLALAYSAYAFALGVFLLSVGEIANVSVNNALLDKFSSQHMKGAYFGAANLSMLGFSLGPFFGGIILQYTNGAILYLFTAGLAALCLLFYSWCYTAR